MRIQIIGQKSAGVRIQWRLRFLVAVTLLLPALSLLLGGCSGRAKEPVLEQIGAADETADQREKTDDDFSEFNSSGDDSRNSEETAAQKDSLPTGKNDNEDGNENDNENDDENSVTVHVCGAVQKEGVYTLPAGSRIRDAVDAAGGFAQGADTEWLNLAARLEDEWQICVPTKDEAEELRAMQLKEASGRSDQSDQQKENGGKISLNKASREELMKIPGIGEKKAQSIIEYREQNGRFESIEDLMKVPGIKEASFQKLKEYITE